jgi:glyoxylase-like metal-dependent hydrolase (beta-lactamase superfamily II)
MIIEEITVTAFQQHTRIVGCEKTRLAMVIDPGDEAELISERIDQLGLKLQSIGMTHAHLDHIGAVAALKRLRPEAKVTLHQADEFIYDELPQQPAWIGIPRSQWKVLGLEFETPPKADEYWHDNQTFNVGEIEFRVIHTPGHTPGHVVLFAPKERKVFVGDVLFAGSIGRTDLPGGSTEQLLDSIKNKLLPLGDDVEVYSGHGPTTTLGHERLTNPFLTGVYRL